MPPTTILIAEDQPVYRDGLVSAIATRPGLKVVGTSDSGEAAIGMALDEKPDVLVLDVALYRPDGLAVIRSVTGDDLPTRVLVLSDNLARETIYDAVSAGASGYITKRADAEEICDAIEQIAAAKTVWGPDVQDVLASEIRGRAEQDRLLSPRELEIVKLVADGRSTSEIAGQLYVSPATVKTHLHRAFTKLEVNDRAAAVAECIRRGMFD